MKGTNCYIQYIPTIIRLLCVHLCLQIPSPPGTWGLVSNIRSFSLRFPDPAVGLPLLRVEEQVPHFPGYAPERVRAVFQKDLHGANQASF